MQNHVFQIEKLRKITLYGVLLIAFLILSLFLLLQTGYIQTKITKFITKELSEQLNTEIDIDNVKLSMFKGFIFKGIYIQDQQKDTLLYVKELSVIPAGFQTNFSNISLKEIHFDSMYLNLYEIGKDTLNIQYIIDALISDEKEKQDNTFKLRSQNISIINSSFRYHLSDTIEKTGLDYTDLKLDSINLIFNKFELNNENISSEVESISLRDKSGFNIQSLISEKIEISPKLIHFKNFSIETADSKMAFDSLFFDFPDSYDFSEYKTKLKANIRIKKASYLSYNDVKYFITDTNTYSEKVQISGIIKGTFDKFDISKLNFKYEGLIDLKMDSKVSNFQDLKDPSLFVNIEQLNVNFQKFQEMKIPGKDFILKELPEGIKKIKIISYSGITKGKLSGFLTRGKISGSFGNISILALAKKDSSSIINVKGKLSGSELNIAQAFENKDLRTMSFSQNFSFSLLQNKKIKLKTSGKINEIWFKNYNYKDIDLFAELYDKKVDSFSISINQKEIKATLFGNVNFISETPEISLTANVFYADLINLNLSKAEKKSTIQFTTIADFKGLNIDDFDGIISLSKPLVYIKDSLSLSLNNFTLTGELMKNTGFLEKRILLNSDIVDAEIITVNKNSEIFNALKILTNNLFHTKYEQSISENTSQTITEGSVNIKMNIKQPEFISSLLFPEYHISKNTKIYGFYEPKSESLNLSLNSKKLKYKKFTVNDFYIIAYTRNKRLYGGIGGSSLMPNESVSLENINLEGDLINDTINFSLNWNNFKDSANYSANIEGFVEMIKNENQKTYYNCAFNQSDININDILWTFNGVNLIIDSTRVRIVDLILKNKDQKVYLDGNISEYPGDILFAEYTNFNISNIQPLLPNNFIINGKLNGSTTFAQLYDDPLIFTRDSIIDLNINNIDFGNFYFKSNWDDKESKIHVNAYNLKGKHKQFMNDTIYGDYWPKTDKINFTVDIRSMLLKTFKDYYSEYTEFNPTAFVAGEINIFGDLKKPYIKGNLKIKQTTAHIKYLDIFCSFDEVDINISNNLIGFNETKITSRTKDNLFAFNETVIPSRKKTGYGYLKGNIKHDNFSNFKIDFDIDAEDLLLMNLKQTDSAYLYGTIFGTGNFNFSGNPDNIHMDSNLKTEEETYLFIPIATNESLDEEKSFIRFVTDTTKTEASSKQEEYKVDFSGFSMNMKLDVSENAEIQIIPDESSEIITKGDGSLNLTLDTDGNFNMFGNYIISEGTYKLDLIVLQKIFDIVKGSKIVWSGDPGDALVDIIAIYKIDNVPLNNLVPESEEQPIEKTDVTCSIGLTGGLLSSKKNLNIEISDKVNSKYVEKINSFDEKEINQQFLALLFFKRFMGTGVDNLGIDDPAPITGDFFTSHLNNMLERFSKDINIDLKYEPGQANITDEYGFEISGEVLEGWVTYKGYGGIGGNDGNREENYVGEFEIEGKLNRKGNIKVKIYNKANDEQLNDGDYTQGAGFVIRQKFDTFFFWKRREESDSLNTIHKKDSLN